MVSVQKNNNSAQSAVYFSNKLFTSKATLFQKSSINAELEAIELALKIAPHEADLMFLIDSKSAIQAIANWKNWNAQKLRSCSYLHTLKRIDVQISTRKNLKKITRLCWIPSHTLDNVDKAELPTIKKTSESNR